MRGGWESITPELPVIDVGQTLAWYRDVLGCRIAWVWDDGGYVLYHRRPCGQGMEHVDRVAHVEGLTKPVRGRGVGVQVQPRCLVPRSQDVEWFPGDLGGRRHLGQEPAIRPAEPQLTLRLSLDLVPLFVDGAVVSATQNREVGQRGRPALGPVPDVMALPDPHAAPREATAAVAML